MTTPENTKFLRRTVWEAMTPEQMVARYDAGMSLNDIGFVAGTSGYQVRKLLVARGVTIRPRFGHPSRYTRRRPTGAC